MYKVNSLRKHLSCANRLLKQNPEQLHIFVDEGNILATGTASLSHEYQYRLNIHIEDYAGPLETITIPLLAWISIHQNDLLANPEKRRSGISLDIDFNNNQTCDILIRLNLTEKSIVSIDKSGNIRFFHQKEPQSTPPYPETFWTRHGKDLFTEWEFIQDGE